MELRERLRLATSTLEVRSSKLERRASSIDGLVRPVETAHGAVHVAEEWWPLDHRHGRRALGDALLLCGPALSRLQPGLSGCDLEGAAFVDVETTGLVGGTGTYVFLVGLGTFDEGTFRLRQFFLADLGGERAMLAAVADALSSCRALVSFNGRWFDLPLLETRFTLSRLPAPHEGLPHLDLLYPARRLYRRRLPSCRLVSLEEALLGLEREDDIPGWAIPSLYFEYLRRGEARSLRTVFRHNALDILSLAALLAHLGRTIGEDPPGDPDDCLALARWDESDGRLADASRLYAAALDGGVDGEGRALALRRLARLHRRQGRWEDAARLWCEEAESGGAVERRLEALIELAKLEEHRHRDYAAAEAITRRALSLVELLGLRGGGRLIPSLGRGALEHRLWRLRRRAAGRAPTLATDGHR